MNIDDQRTLQKDLIAIITSCLQGDERISALWLSGSLGRNEGDALSDIDLIIVAMPARVRDMVGSLERIVHEPGPAVLVHEAPWNAPRDGAQLNVLYDTYPLPIYIDWDVWPNVGNRPAEVTVLFEREPIPADATASVSSIRDNLPSGLIQRRPDSTLNRFRVYMALILVKHAARGWFDFVGRDVVLGQSEIARQAVDHGKPSSLENRRSHLSNVCAW